MESRLRLTQLDVLHQQQPGLFVHERADFAFSGGNLGGDQAIQHVVGRGVPLIWTMICVFLFFQFKLIPMEQPVG